MKKGLIALWVASILLVFAKMCLNSEVLPTLMVFLWSAVMSVYLMIKNGLPSKKGMIISAVLTGLVLFSALTAHKNSTIGTILFTSTTLLSSLAVISVSEKNEEIKLLRAADIKNVLLSLLIGAAVAVPLILINTYFMSKSGTIAPSFGIDKIVMAIHPGIAEEMAFRAVFMAFCIYIADGKMTKGRTVTMYIMMTIPHGLWHGNMGFFSCLMAAVIFGIPFALLQRKRDLTSAMFSHFLVDAVRFILFGG
ncbi:MAG: CPBP family intramembrane metalloprotease [Oscillospiraceae bacterium]|nr:CPBP family intramembrane metalloprotease [Oscillospiraceae bacterium]